MVKGFPSHWRIVELEDCLSALIDYRGKSPRKTTSGIPLITARIVKHGRVEKPQEFIAQGDFSEWMRRGSPQPGDVVLTTEAPLGEIAQLDSRKVALGQRLITLRGKPDFLDNTYLKFQMQAPFVQRQLIARSTGTTVLGIRQSELRKVSLVIPPFEEQLAIAQVLGALDDKIELNYRMNETLEAMVGGLFRSWFVCDFRNRGAQNGVPCSLGDLIDIKHGYAFQSEFFVDEKQGDILLTPGNFAIGGGFKSDKFKYYEGPVPQEFILSEGDLLVTMTDLSIGGDSLGYGALLPAPPIQHRFLHNQRLGKIIIRNSTIVGKAFLFQVLRTSEYRAEILGGATGTTVRHTSPSRIKAFKINLPPPSLMKKYEDFAAPCWQRIGHNLRESQILSNLRDVLLPKLISGKIRTTKSSTIVKTK